MEEDAKNNFSPQERKGGDGRGREGGGGAHIFSWALLFSFSVSLPSSFVSQPEEREGQRDHPSVQEGEGESKYQNVGIGSIRRQSSCVRK